MKKRIITSVVITVLFALLIITSSFITIVSIEEIKTTKNLLKNYNEIIINSNEINENYLSKFKINNTKVSFIILSKEGKPLYGEIENPYLLEEFKEAKENGEGSSERYDYLKEKDMIYCTNEFSDGKIIRSGIPIKRMNILVYSDMKYYIFVLIGVFLLSIALAFKLVRTIIEPITNLQNVTSKIASGNLNTRVNISSNDELGSLGKTFNNMADQLEGKIKEVVDKQNRLETVLKSMQSGLIAIDNEDKVILMNPYAKKILGIKKDILKEDISNYILDKNMLNIILSGDKEEKEIKVKKPFKRILKIKKDLMLNGYKRVGYVIAIQDITEMKRLENMRTQFVANVSHELKTPLTSIKGFSETLRYVQDEETKNKFLDIIDKESERLTRLINDILTLSNLENFEVEELEEFIPDKIIENSINILTKHSEKKKIKINYISENKNYILGKEDKFQQIVINLIENAIKYSEEEKNIYVESYSKEGMYYLKVKDEGIGIPKKDLPRIFERFYRVDKARKRGGTGLGLAITKHIVKLFGGKIEVKSIYGEGSEFIFKVKHL